MRGRVTSLNSGWMLVALLLLFILAITLTGRAYYQKQETELVQAIHAQLSTIADLKKNQIADWYEERRDDAEAILNNPMVLAQARLFLRNPQEKKHRLDLLAWMNTLRRAYHYSDVALFDRNGKVCLSVPDDHSPLDVHFFDQCQIALRSARVIFVDLHRSTLNDPTHMSFWIPIRTINDDGNPADGAILLLIDPSKSLYPLIQKWPTQSSTAEVLLVRREGEEVVYLNELRHRSNTALSLRFPLSRRDMAVVKAVLGETGVVEGIDYRNIPVLAALRAIPGTPWFLVAKVDRKEIFSPLRARARNVLVVTMLLMFASSLGGAYLWNLRQLAFAQSKLVTDRKLELRDQMIKHSHDAIIMMDAQRIVTEWNAGAEELYGISKQAATGRVIFQLLESKSETNTIEEIGEILKKEGHWEGELVQTHQDGALLIVHSRQILLRGERGDIGILEVDRDITERKRVENALRESEEQFRAIFEMASIGMAQADPRTGRWVRVNQRMCAITGYSAVEMLQMSLSEVTHPDDRQRDWEAFQSVVRGEASDYRVEKRYLRKDGTLAWVNVNMTVLRDAAHQPMRTIAAIEDITDRKQGEIEIRRLNESLDQRVRDRTAQLEAANHELAAFSYSVSHDLRAPLRGIDGWSLALLEDYGDRLDERAHQHLGRIRFEAQKMGILIDDLLQLSRVIHVKMQKEPVDLTCLAQSIAVRLQESQPHRQMGFVIQPGLIAFGDSQLLEIVLTNLLDNACKFTGPRPVARIELGQTAQAGPTVFFVRDNGVGLDMAYVSKLFNPFQRLHHTSEFPGTGIGLAIVQRILHRHGGRIWVESEIDVGTTFYFVVEEIV